MSWTEVACKEEVAVGSIKKCTYKYEYEHKYEVNNTTVKVDKTK